MKTRIQASGLFFAFLLLIAGCATVPKYDPFVVPKSTIRATVKTIAIYHPKTNNPVEVQFERLIEERLRAGGFTPVGTDRTTPLAEQETQSLGGLYDPQTGQEDRAKSEIYWRNLLQSVKTNCNADAMLAFTVVGRSARFYGDRAEWDGTSEGVYMHKSFADALLASGTEYGTTEGLSLKVLLSNLQHENLFVNYGGIQLATKLSRPAKVLRKQDFVEVPQSDLFTDTNRIFGAVTNALGPLTN